MREHSSMDSDTHLGVLDYLVFGISLMVCLGIAIYHACKRHSSETTEGYLAGGHSLKVIPLTISLVVSVISAVTLLGLPAEMYTYGSQYMLNFGSGLGIILTTVIFVPLLHPLRLTSMFEYLERRFGHRLVRLWGSLLEVLALLLYGGTALYAPATALAAVTPLATWMLCVLLGGLVAVYTSLGGLRGVVWTDVFQAGIMLIGLIAIFIQGIISVGGISEVYRYNSQGDRLNFYTLDPDPRTRHTFWGLSAGFAFGGLSFYGASQFTFQRFSATKRLSDAKLTVLLNLPLFYGFHILLCLTGLLIYAYYAKLECDPIKSGRIVSTNQLLPLFVRDTLGKLPAFTGLFMAALTSGALSTLSSVLHSASALVWQDFLRVLLKNKLSPQQSILFNKLLVCICGGIVISLTFIADNFGPHIFQVCFALLGASGGPQLGMFLLGALIPWANAKGALIGCMSGIALTVWMTIGTYLTKPFAPGLPLNYENQCTNDTSRFTNATLPTLPSGGLLELYKVSYVWYSLIGSLTCVLVGMLVSAATGFIEPDPVLVLPWYNNVRRFFCKSCIKESESTNHETEQVPLQENSNLVIEKSDANVS